MTSSAGGVKGAVAKDDKKKRRKTTSSPAGAPDVSALQGALERERRERAEEADTTAKMLLRLGDLEADLHRAQTAQREAEAGKDKIEQEITRLLERMAELEDKNERTAAELTGLRGRPKAERALSAGEGAESKVSAGLETDIERLELRNKNLERHIDQQQREIVALKIDLEEARMKLKRAEESQPKPQAPPEPPDSGPEIQEVELSEAEAQAAMLTGFMSDLGETIADFILREEQYFAFRKAVLEDIQLAVMEKLGPQHTPPPSPPPLPELMAPVRRLSSAGMDISQITEMLSSLRPPALAARLSREMRAAVPGRPSAEMASVQTPAILRDKVEGDEAAEARPRSQAPAAPSQPPAARASQRPKASPSRAPSRAPSKAPPTNE